jgi:hypothetical protein
MTSEVMGVPFILGLAPAGNGLPMGRLLRAVRHLHHFRFVPQEQPEIDRVLPNFTTRHSARDDGQAESLPKNPSASAYTERTSGVDTAPVPSDSKG